MRKQKIESVLDVKECTFGSFKCIFKVCFSKGEMDAPMHLFFSKMPGLFFSFFHMNLLNIMGKKMLNEVLMDLYTRHHLLCKAFLK
jgi:hypothetical protein